MNQFTNQIKYRQIKTVHFTIDQQNHVLKNKIYKYTTSVPKNIYIDKLDDIVNKYNNKYHNTIKMKLVDVKSNTYIDSSK